MEEKYYISTVSSSDSLMHYGVMGMKWGIRRYQNKDGTLTAEGRKRAYAEYKKDNATAFELGKSATLYGRASVKGTNKVAKLEQKVEKALEKDPNAEKRSTQKKQQALEDAKEATKRIQEKAAIYEEKARAHCDELISKYGSENVKTIKYKDVKYSKNTDEYKTGTETRSSMNERTASNLEIAACIGATVASKLLLSAVGASGIVLVTPGTTNSKATSVYNGELGAVKYERQQREAEERKNASES